MSESNQAKLKMGTLFGFGELERVLLSWVQKYIPPLAAGGKLHFIEREYEPAAGILVLPAFGHTPGHMAVLVFCAVRETNLPGSWIDAGQGRSQ